MRVVLAEIRLDLILVEMHRRRNDVARRLAPQLNDIFAKIGLHRLDARIAERLVDGDLLGDHRLALGHRFRIVFLADFEDRLAGLLGRLAPVHMATGRDHLVLPGNEIKVEVGKRVVLDVAGLVA